MDGTPGSDRDDLVDLMVRYQGGRMEAFAGLYGELQRPLLGYLRTFVRDPSTADDLLQESFLQLHRARHTYTPPRPVRPWVYAIARHVALMHLRSKRRRKEFLAADELPEVPVPPEMEQLADRATLQKLLATLPKEGREVLVLHHLVGLSYEEIGQIVGARAGTAKVRAHRALRSLREQVAGCGETE